jgi:hypothetical protein
LFFQSVILSEARRKVCLPQRVDPSAVEGPRSFSLERPKRIWLVPSQAGPPSCRDESLRYGVPSHPDHAGPSAPARRNLSARHISLSPSLRMTELCLRGETFAEISCSTATAGRTFPASLWRGG